MRLISMNAVFGTSVAILFPIILSGQSLSGDSLLATERSIDRPITVHRHQLRISGGYGVSFLARRYDAAGRSVRLSGDETPSTRHRFTADLKYGVSEFLQVNLATAYSVNTVRAETTYIDPTGPDPVVSHDVLRQYTGLEDLFAAIDFRAPLKTRKIDIGITLGASIPIARSNQPEPQHSLEVRDDGGATTHNFVYRYRYPRGMGVTIATAGAMTKLRSRYWAFSARIDYHHAMAEGSSYVWRHQIESDGSFQYRKDTFGFRLPNAFYYYAETEYQPRSWLDIFVNVSGHTGYGGWTESQEGLKIATRYQTSWRISPGAEIIINPRLWIRERLNFSVGGRSFEAPFSIESTVIYNFFPFVRR